MRCTAIALPLLAGAFLAGCIDPEDGGRRPRPGCEETSTCEEEDGGFDGGTDGGTDGGEDGGTSCASTCAGCCTETGDCLGGAAASACGKGGLECLDCGTHATCTAAGVCQPDDPAGGDSCEHPIDLLLVGGRAAVRTSLDPLRDEDDAQPGCAGSGWPDRAFRVTLPAPGTLLVRALPEEGRAPLLALREGCGSSVEHSCKSAPASGANELSVQLNGGEFFIWVESASAARFTLELEYTPAERVACAGATELALVAGRALVTGAFTSKSPEVPSCYSTRPGVIYEVETTATGTLSAIARSTPNRFITLELAYDCSSDAEIACDDGSYGVPAVVRLPNAPPGRYALAVAGETLYSAPGHEFSLEVLLEPTPPNYACSGATPLSFTGGRATVSGTTAGAVNDHFSFCLNISDSDGQDVYYRFDLAQPRSLKAHVKGTSEGSKPTLSLRRGACNGTELDCGLHSAAGAVLERRSLAPGRYFLVVDSRTEGPGAFDLTVELGEPAGGESCADPMPLAFSTDGEGKKTATAQLDMGQVERNEVTRCNSYNINSTDAVFSFTTDGPFDLRAESKWKSGVDGVAHLGLFRGGCAAEDELTCASEGVASTLTRLDVRGLAAGSYFLLLQSFSSYEVADIDLTVTLTPPVPGDGCGLTHSLSVPAGGGQVTASGDSTGFFGDVKGSCSSSGPDALYTFTTTAPMGLRGEVTTTTTGFTPALHLKTAGECPGGTEVACAAGSAGKASLVKSVLPAGSYLLAVDSTTTKGGAYALKLDFTPAAAGETCDAPIPLTFSSGLAGGTASATGTTVGLFDDVSACSRGFNNPDRVYSFSIDRELNLVASLASTSGYTRPFLSLRQACTGYDVTCGSAEWDKPSTLKVGSLTPGTYLLVADTDVSGTGATGFSYALEATLAPPPPGDTCATALPLGISEGTVTVQGDTTPYFHQKIACNQTGPDVVYAFTTQKVLDLKATAVRDGSTSPWEGRLVLASSCAVRSDCSSLAYASAEVGRLSPGTYYLVVDSYDASRAGPFKLEVSLTEPVVGDSCALPLDLFEGPARGTVTVDGNTSDAFDDQPDGSCGDSSPGRDLVYRFTTTEKLNLRARAAGPTTYAPIPALTLLKEDCKSEVACQRAGSSVATVMEKADLPPGTYLLVAESSSLTYGHGPFTLTVTLEPPAEGDQCANAVPLEFGPGGGTLKVSGTTAQYFDDLRGACASGGTNTKSPDRVYRFTTSATRNLRVRAAPTGTSWRPITYLMKDSCSSNPLYCDWAPSYMPVSEEDVAALTAGTYYLVIDGYTETAFGSYELEVSLMPVAQGESCANPLPLAFTDGRASASGNIEDWFPDMTGACSPLDGLGEELVYSFTATQPSYFRAVVDTTSESLRPMLLLRSGTCSSANAACANASYTARPAELATRVAAGTHFLVVESVVNRSKGAFTLEAELGAPPPGDACANPLPITFSGNTATVLGRTHLFLDDFTLGCGGASGARDVVYSFTTTEVRNLSVVSSSPNYNLQPVLALRSSCAGSDLACVKTDLNGRGTLTRSALPAGTHYLFVDPAGTSPGDYKLELTLSP